MYFIIGFDVKLDTGCDSGYLAHKTDEEIEWVDALAIITQMAVRSFLKQYNIALMLADQ